MRILPIQGPKGTAIPRMYCNTKSVKLAFFTTPAGKVNGVGSWGGGFPAGLPLPLLFEGSKCCECIWAGLQYVHWEDGKVCKTICSGEIKGDGILGMVAEQVPGRR